MCVTQGAPVFPGSSRLGIEPKTPGWLVQDPTTSPGKEEGGRERERALELLIVCVIVKVTGPSPLPPAGHGPLLMMCVVVYYCST